MSVMKPETEEAFNMYKGTVDKPQLCGVRNELVNALLFENDPSLKQFEQWFAKGNNAAIKKALKIIDAHFA